MQKGDHFITPLLGPTTHHGIYLGDGTVVHWSSGLPGNKSFRDVSTRKSSSRILHTPVEDFGDPSRVSVRDYDSCFAPDEVVERALSRVGESGYCLVTNNCEHFATKCKTDSHRSRQVETVVTGGGLTTGGGVRLAGRVARHPVARNTARTFVMRVAPAAGVVGAASAGVCVGVEMVKILFPMPPADPEPRHEEGTARRAEREALLVGRAAGTSGAVVAGLGSVGAVAAAGIPGLSAVGVATGLTAIGGTVAGGVAVTVAAPIVAALGAGYLGYWLWKR